MAKAECPEHGEQEVIRTGVTRGVDPYMTERLECGHTVTCYGLDEPSIILETGRSLWL